MFGKYAGSDVPVFGVGSRNEELLILREEEIFGVVMSKDDRVRADPRRGSGDHRSGEVKCHLLRRCNSFAEMLDRMTDLLNSIDRAPRAPSRPEWVERVCADFGITESGALKYRVMWNPDRRRVMNILNPETGQHVQKNLMKYPRVGERWILETLMPWEQVRDLARSRPSDPSRPMASTCSVTSFSSTWLKMMNAPADERTEFHFARRLRPGQSSAAAALHREIEGAAGLAAAPLRRRDAGLAKSRTFTSTLRTCTTTTWASCARSRSWRKTARSDLARSPAPRD
jgi:hypothetical protein